MTKQDWLTASMVAVGVAAMTVAMTALPMCWAGETPVVAIPALPSAQLTIPAMNAQVSATATPAPGQDVSVALKLKSPARTNVVQVPVLITVLGTNMEPMSRSVPPAQQVAQVAASVPVGPDGNGSAIVKLPLTWAVPAQPQKTVTTDTQNANATSNVQRVTSYQMVLSSTLGGQAAPASLQIITSANIPSNTLRTLTSQTMAQTASRQRIAPVFVRAPVRFITPQITHPLYRRLVVSGTARSQVRN